MSKTVSSEQSSTGRQEVGRGPWRRYYDLAALRDDLRLLEATLLELHVVSPELARAHVDKTLHRTNQLAGQAILVNT